MFQLSRRSFARDVGSVGRRGSAAVSLPEMLSGWVGGGGTQILGERHLEKDFWRNSDTRRYPVSLLLDPRGVVGEGMLRRRLVSLKLGWNLNKSANCHGVGGGESVWERTENDVNLKRRNMAKKQKNNTMGKWVFCHQAGKGLVCDILISSRQITR